MSSSIIKQLGINAKNAASKLTNIQAEKKNKALDYLKRDLKSLSSKIINVNKKDIKNAHAMKLSSAMIDRLTLNEEKINK